MAKRKDVMRPSKEEISRQLSMEKTGYDLLLEQKEANIDKLDSYLIDHPDATRKQISEATGISVRSISRYMTILKERYGKDVIKNVAEKQLEDKNKRMAQLKELLAKEPTLTRKKLAEKLGVSLRTLKSYLRELK
jgi:transcription initiation factor IIE alpha subunit